MALTFSDRPQIYGDRRRLSDPGEIGDHFTSKFPSHARPINQMPDNVPGPYGGGVWKIYERDYDAKTNPAGWGFRHRDTIWRRVPERDHWGQTTWVTRGVFSHPTMFSS